MGTLSTVLRGWPAAVLLLLGTLVLGIAAPAAWAAGAPRQFDIPAEPLGPALDEFARQADVTLLFSSTLVAHARTGGVHGDLAVATALGRLLGGTQLSFRQVSPSAIAIVESPGRGAAAANASAPAAGSPVGSSPGSAAAAAPASGREHGVLR